MGRDGLGVLAGPPRDHRGLGPKETAVRWSKMLLAELEMEEGFRRQGMMEKGVKPMCPGALGGSAALPAQDPALRNGLQTCGL